MSQSGLLIYGITRKFTCEIKREYQAQVTNTGFWLVEIRVLTINSWTWFQVEFSCKGASDRGGFEAGWFRAKVVNV